MKYWTFAGVIALTLAVAVSPDVHGQTPALREGVSVQLAATSNAVAFPAADDADAWIITVTAEGSLYFGVKPVSPEQLREEMRITPRRRDARLYIKADGRSPFVALKQALRAAHEDLLETVVLLTEKLQNSSPRGFVPPQGLEISLASPAANATVVRLEDSSGASPGLKVNDQQIPWSKLQSAMAQASPGQGRNIVIIEADDDLSSASVIRVVDLSRLIGRNVAISLSGL
jgi:biopolymer transport protein ExbD